MNNKTQGFLKESFEKDAIGPGLLIAKGLATAGSWIAKKKFLGTGIQQLGKGLASQARWGVKPTLGFQKQMLGRATGEFWKTHGKGIVGGGIATSVLTPRRPKQQDQYYG